MFDFNISIKQVSFDVPRYKNTPHSTTHETPAQLMFGRSTRLQFDTLIPNPNTNEVVFERQISQIKNEGNRTI